MNSKIFLLLKQMLTLVKDSFDASTTIEEDIKTKICFLLDSPRLQQENCTENHHVVSGISDIFREIIPLNTALLALLPMEDSNAVKKAHKILTGLTREIRKEKNDDSLQQVHKMKYIWNNINQSEYFK